MRILSALVLTHCFGCVIPEDSDDDFTRNSSIIDRNLMVQISPDPQRPVANSTDFHDWRVRHGHGAAERQTVDTDDLAGSMDYHRTSGLLRKRGGRVLHSLSGMSASVGTLNNDNQVIVKRTASGRHRRRGSQPSSYAVPRQSARGNWRAPLRMQLRHILAEPRVGPECHSHEQKTAQRGHRSKGDCVPCHKPAAKARHDTRVVREDDWDDEDEQAAEVTEETQADSGEWDEWTDWSECSASCGCGRQVRWRHCVGKGCISGFKKAQIRMCHLRDCNSKSFLSWLGMKTS